MIYSSNCLRQSHCVHHIKFLNVKKCNNYIWKFKKVFHTDIYIYIYIIQVAIRQQSKNNPKPSETRKSAVIVDTSRPGLAPTSMHVCAHRRVLHVVAWRVQWGVCRWMSGAVGRSPWGTKSPTTTWMTPSSSSPSSPATLTGRRRPPGSPAYPAVSGTPTGATTPSPYPRWHAPGRPCPQVLLAPFGGREGAIREAESTIWEGLFHQDLNISDRFGETNVFLA